jgi:hypothetical protein
LTVNAAFMIRALFDHAMFLPFLLVVLVVAYEFGHRLTVGVVSDYKGRPVESALIGLLSLLLGFTFSQTGASYRERLALVHREADAVADCHRFATILPASERTQLRKSIHDYLTLKSKQYISVQQGAPENPAELPLMQAQRAIYAAPENPHLDIKLRCELYSRCNHIVQLHFQGYYSRQERIPQMVIALLVFGSTVGSFLVGFSTGVHQRRIWVVPTVFIFLVTMTVGTIRDLDEPYGGFIKVDFSNMVELREVLEAVPN